MSRTYYHRHKRKLWRDPRWYIRLHYTKRNRQTVRQVLTNLPVDLEDTPELPKGHNHSMKWGY